MPIETIIAPVGKSDPSFDLQADIIFGGNGGGKINKFLDCVKSIVIDRNPRINTDKKPLSAVKFQKFLLEKPISEYFLSGDTSGTFLLIYSVCGLCRTACLPTEKLLLLAIDPPTCATSTLISL